MVATIKSWRLINTQAWGIRIQIPILSLQGQCNTAPQSSALWIGEIHGGRKRFRVTVGHKEVCCIAKAVDNMFYSEVFSRLLRSCMRQAMSNLLHCYWKQSSSIKFRLMIRTEECAFDLGSCLHTEKPTVPRLWPVTDVFHSTRHWEEMQLFFVHYILIIIRD